MDENIDFIAEPVHRDGGKMLQVSVVDTEPTISRVIDSVILTQNLEAYTGGSDKTLPPGVTPVSELLTEGDKAIDKENPNEKNLTVIERTAIPAVDYNLFPDETIADRNPEYPDDDIVIKCKFYEDASMTYTFPESRLEPLDE